MLIARPFTDRGLIEQLYKSMNLAYNPIREVGHTRINSYGDTFILDYAAMHVGVVVTRNNFRDQANVSHSHEYR